MIQYTETKPTVYIETTVVSYLVARPSKDVTIASRQQATQRLWDDYFGTFTFVVSDIVHREAGKGDALFAQRRLDALADFTVLETLPAVETLVQQLIDTRAVPQESRPDAEHIAIATVHGIDYLVTWNYKHIANEVLLPRINKVCRTAGYKPTTLCTPEKLMEEIEMIEKPDTQAEAMLEEGAPTLEDYPAPFKTQEELFAYLKSVAGQTDAVLEECYRMKAEYAAQFKTQEELSEDLKQAKKEGLAQGRKYVAAPPPPPEFVKKFGLKE